MSSPATNSEEKELAQKAHSEFLKKNYDACLSILDKLLEKHPNDVKILHNRAITSFYKSKQCDVSGLNKQMNTLFNKAEIKTEQLSSFENMEHSVLLYNKAALLYFQNQYTASLNIAEKLFEFIEPFDEGFTCKVSFLLLELYLSTYQADKALSLATYLEKILFPDSQKEKEETNNIYRPTLHYYKARCFILLKSAKSCKKELKGLGSHGDGVWQNYLRSQLDYQRGTYKKAIRTMNSGVHSLEKLEKTGNMLPVFYYNNLACLYFHMNKHAIGCHYQDMAMKEYKTIMVDVQEKKRANLLVFTSNLSLKYRLLYNAGIQNLHAMRPNEAFDYLMAASRIFNNNPRLLLRLAECAIMKNKMENSPDFDDQRRKQQNLVQKQIGFGKYTKLILTENLGEKVKPSGSSSAIPNPTLEFAYLCLENAFYLLPDEVTEPVEDKPPIFVNSYPSLPNQDVGQLRNSILAAKTYISLCLGNFYVAINDAELLLEQPKISGLHKSLAHLYLAEGLILKNDMSNAIKNLQSNLVVSVEPDRALTIDWNSHSHSLVKAAFHYNLSYAYTLQRDWHKASETLNNVIGSKDFSEKDIPIQVILLNIYINLQKGQSEFSRTMLKHCSNLSFPITQDQEAI